MKTHASLLLAALSVLTVAQERPPIKYDEGAIREIGGRMDKLVSKNWQDGFAFGQELAELPSPLGYQIMRDHWNGGASLEGRKQMFKGFVFDKHPDTLLVLNLGMRDPHRSMQSWSMAYLKSEYLVDFSMDFSSYGPWFESVKALPPKEVRNKSLTMLYEALLTVPDDRLEGAAMGAAQTLQNAPPGSYAKADALVNRLIDSPGAGPNSAALAATLLAKGFLPKDGAVKASLRLLDKPTTLANPVALRAIAEMDAPKLRGRFMEVAKIKATDHTEGLISMVDALLQSEDPATIPFVIGLIPSLEPDMAREMSSTLANNLGVPAGAAWDAAGWQAWLEKNRDRFTMKSDPKLLPSFKIDAVPTAQYIPDAEDVKAIPSASFLVGEDPKKRYLVSGKIEPGKPKNVLVVMPGGDGSPDFHPFVKRIQMNVLDENWIVVQPIAPRWDNNEDRVVWPSEGVPYAAAKFPMESFLDGMFDELRTRHKLNVGKTYMLGWSSSGPAIYSYAAHGKHTIDGAFVAMAVFNPEFFGDAKTLAVKRFYLLHSPQDFIKMSHPEAAKAKLESMKIPVTLTTYEGGHGWHGPVFDMIAQGMDFLKK